MRSAQVPGTWKSCSSPRLAPVNQGQGNSLLLVSVYCCQEQDRRPCGPFLAYRYDEPCSLAENRGLCTSHSLLWAAFSKWKHRNSDPGSLAPDPTLAASLFASLSMVKKWKTINSQDLRAGRFKVFPLSLLGSESGLLEILPDRLGFVSKSSRYFF